MMFPGQGSQFPGMADPWLAHPAGRDVLEEASKVMGRDVVMGCHDTDALVTTSFVQPALLAVGLAAWAVIRAESEAPVVGVAGHSLGEFAALVAAGVLTLAETLDLVVVRGDAMQKAGRENPGTMAALLGVGAQQAGEMCEDARRSDVLVVANVNSPVQTVVSGSVTAVERLESLAAERKVRAVRLKVAGAFHSPLMEPAVAAINERIDALEFRAPNVPIAENVSGSLVSDAAELKGLLRRHVVSPVLWEDCARSLGEADAFLEAGAGDVLTKLQKRIDPDVRAVAVGSPQAVREALA